MGPLSYKSAPMEVEAVYPVPEGSVPKEEVPPAVKDTLDSMRAQGVKSLYGRWLIEGSPKVILFDTGSMYHRLDEWKADLYNLAGIPTPPNDHETNETIVFGYIVAWFLGEVRLFSLIGSCISPLSLSHPPPNSSPQNTVSQASGTS